MGRGGACVPREVLVQARVGHGRRRAESERKWFLLKTLTENSHLLDSPRLLEAEDEVCFTGNWAEWRLE